VLSARQLERRAEALLDLAVAVGHAAGPPVPVEWLVEHALDLCIVWDALPTDPDAPVLGGLDPVRGEVVLNDREAKRFAAFPGLESFTLAHEVGHWLLHVPPARRRQPMLPGLGRGQARPCAGGGSTATARREQQADTFAALLLMPARLLVPRCAGLDLSRFPARYKLRDEFGVSITAMNLRLRALGFGWFDEQNRYIAPKRARAAGGAVAVPHSLAGRAVRGEGAPATGCDSDAVRPPLTPALSPRGRGGPLSLPHRLTLLRV